MNLSIKLLPLLVLSAFSCFAQKQITVPENTPSLQKFLAAHNGYQITIPAGTYVLNNASQASGLSLSNFTGELDFASGAKLLCNTATTSGGWCVNIQNSSNLVIRGLWVGYTVESGLPLPRASATNGAIQIWNCSNVSVYNPHVDASTGLGFIIGVSSNASVSQAEVFNTSADGLSFINDAASSLNGLYANNTGDDGLSVINYDFYANKTGFTGTNIQSYRSAARGISVPGQSNVNISNFYVANAASSGIITLTDPSFQTRRPSNVTWSNGQIANSGLYGIQTDASDGVSYSGIQVSNSASGGWFGCANQCNNISSSNLTVTAGVNDSAMFLGSINQGTFSNITITNNPTYGMYITKSSGLSLSGITITDVSQKDSLGRAWWAESNVGGITVTGLTVVDNQLVPTGYVVGEYSDPSQAIKVTNITPNITHGSIAIQSSSPGSVFQMNP